MDKLLNYKYMKLFVSEQQEQILEQIFENKNITCLNCNDSYLIKDSEMTNNSDNLFGIITTILYCEKCGKSYKKVTGGGRDTWIDCGVDKKYQK